MEMQNGTAAKENSMNTPKKKKLLHDPAIPFLDIHSKSFK